MPEPTVRLENVGKLFRVAAGRGPGPRVMERRAPVREVQALDAVSMEARAGEVYGVLGPNGSGKTTLMKIVGTILLPDRGSVRLFGEDATKATRAMRRRLGVALGEYERTFHWRLTGRQNLRFFADFYELPKAEVHRRVDEVLGLVGLGEVSDRMYLEYSTGMKHRLALARGLLPDPDLLVLDEPTAGLDLASSLALGETVQGIARQGKTVVYTTHRLHEAAGLCDRIMLLREGRVAAEAPPRDLLKLAEERVVVRLRTAGLEPRLVWQVKGLRGVQDAFLEGNEVRLHVAKGVELAPLLGDIGRLGVKVVDVNSGPPELADVYLKLTALEDPKRGARRPDAVGREAAP